MLGVDEVVAELLPEQKSAFVGRLVHAGNIVAMVGDGVNDASALTRATVGVAMGFGTDLARESADVVLLGNDLSRFIDTVRTIAVDCFGNIVAALGFLNPLSAAFIHVTSELAFILDATRMLAPRERTL